MLFSRRLIGFCMAAFALANCRAVSAQQPPQAEAYYVTVELKQSHFSLDIGDHIKDGLNAVKFPLPVAQQKFQSLKRGQSLVDAFRGGSFWMEGSLGKTKLTIVNVPTVNSAANPTACRVRLELRQSRLSLDIGKHIKDAANAIKFDWDIPCDVYDNATVGTNFIKDGFRTGSFIVRGSAGKWALNVIEKKGPVR